MREGRPGASPLAALACVLIAGAILAPLVFMAEPWPTFLRDRIRDRAPADTGAPNLVSAIYLGYRAFDTLGETIVLILAVGGAVGIIGAGSGTFGGANPSPVRRRRTELLQTVTGKLGPIVLLFGLYLMLYGHLSPGGGFQGGVVIASGIVFIALGGEFSEGRSLSDPKLLARLEAGSFAAFLLSSAAGYAAGRGFLGDPLPGGPPAAFIVALNAIIGLKVGSGVALLCVAMLGEAQR